MPQRPMDDERTEWPPRWNLPEGSSMVRHEEREEPTQRQSLVSEYFTTLRVHRVLIALFALGGLTVFILLGVSSLPLYRTRTSIEIQGLNGDFIGMKDVAATGDNTAQAADLNLQTQIKLLQSDTLLHTTVTEVEREPHSATTSRNDLLSRAARKLHLAGEKTIPYNVAVEDAARRVKVKPMGLTRLVEVSCESWSPEISAEFCNTFTRQFAAGDLETRTRQARKTSEWLTQQAAEMRQKTQDSEKELEAATGGNGLILSQQSSSVGEDRLRQLQDELVKAQAERMGKEADAQVSKLAQADTVPGVVDNPNYRAYQQKLADLHGKLAELVPGLTEENPKVIHLRSQIAEAEAGLVAASTASNTRQVNEYVSARHREDLLNLAYHAQESNVSADLRKVAQVSLLRKEVESEQQLYQTLLARSKEAGLAAALQASTVRVVDPAEAPHAPYSPQRGLSAMAGLVLGSLFGTGLAFYKDRSSRVFRMPGEVSRYLHVHELGVIPAAQRLSGNAFADKGVTGATIESLDASTDSTPTAGRALALTRWNDDFSLVAEAYRNATFSILLSDASKRTRTYVVASPNSGEGKTTVTSNLGVALSKSKLRVLLIDGDLRKPNLHTAFGLSNEFGLRNILRGELDLESAPLKAYTRRTSLPNLSIIPSGVGNEDIVELLHSSFVGGLLARLTRDFDIILIDTPPVLHMADARIFAGQSDGVIAVFRAAVTEREQATALRNLFEHDGVRLVGTILNDFDPAKQGHANYYKSYYRYRDEQAAVETGLAQR